MTFIERIDVFPVQIPVTGTFQFASGTAARAGGTAPHVFVRITDSDGAHGWGEARPSPGWSAETLETVVTSLRRYIGPALEGHPVHDRHGLHRRLDRTLGGHPTGQPIARSAVDLAVHDLLARRASLPLRAFLGGSLEPVVLALSYTLTDHTPDDARATVERQSCLGYAHFNFKVGVDEDTDIAVAAAVRASAPPGAFVWADANQSLSLREARKLATAFTRIGIDLLEQPLRADAQHDMAALRAHTSLPLAIDEACVSPTDYFRYAALGLVDYLVLKLTRSGGIWPTMQQVGIARAAGHGLVVSGLTDSLLTRAAGGQVAAAFGCEGPLALNGGQFLDESELYPEGRLVEHDGALHLDGAHGIGVEPDVQVLKKLLVGENL